ncbi:hypothetical protein XENOCAPTIV_008630 [Xenoophorus captivus]|uniref:Uncharacterized protein n=1 Tax=Xenoophorus captivus TaxID=1517983 RepID=A0ABV0RDJ9_9TELE
MGHTHPARGPRASGKNPGLAFPPRPGTKQAQPASRPRHKTTLTHPNLGGAPACRPPTVRHDTPRRTKQASPSTKAKPHPIQHQHQTTPKTRTPTKTAKLILNLFKNIY